MSQKLTTFAVDSFTVVLVHHIVAVRGNPEDKSVDLHLDSPGPNGDYKLVVREPKAIDGLWVLLRSHMVGFGSANDGD